MSTSTGEEERVAERTRSMVQAIGEALHQAMEEDPTVIVLGEDVVGGAGLGPPLEGSMGGTFGATKTLFPAFGASRVRDAPISEAGFVGAAVGAAAAGLRPVVDVMWSSFAPLAFDQIFNQAAKMRYMFGGQAKVPLVLRMAMGAGLGAAGQHSDTLYSVFTHAPGLKVVVPTNPHDAKGLLISSILDDNPVVFLEHMGLYNSKGPVPEEMYTVPLGVAEVVHAGSDVTIVGVALMAKRALEAAEVLSADGVEAEVIDPRTLSPLDEETILGSVERTGRLVIVDESPPRCSVATDIAALAADRAFGALRAPVKRVSAPHTPVPLSPPLERAYIPSVDRIVEAVRSIA
ncbi:MAG: alpha-ketoacid dehydrogenase subunit beta [Actinomycetota bacterium]